jgi:sugar-specific transcriptional regulator TrmB
MHQKVPSALQAKKRKNMSLKRVLKTLESFGLSHVESEVYVYLAKAGPSKGEELSTGLRMTKQQLYSALKGLREKGIVASRPERARLFSAIAFEELLNLFMKLSAEKAKVVRETKQELVDSWRDMTQQNNS